MALTYVLDSEAAPSRVRRFKEMSDLTLVVFLATGAVLTFNRLSLGPGGGYAVVLVLHVVSALLLYQFAVRWRRGGLNSVAWDGRLVLGFGALAVLLAAVLKGVFESGIGGQF